MDSLENPNELQSLLLQALHHKHVEEWKVMLALLSRNDLDSLKETLSVETSLQRDNRVTALQQQRESLGLKETSKQHKILAEALAVRHESVRQMLSLATSRDDQSGAVTDHDADVHLVSQLLQFQLVEAQIYLEAFVVEDAEDLKENYATICMELSESHVINIASVAFIGLVLPGTSEGEAALVEAVSGKYDALRDQLLIQALIDQMGEAEWTRLSDLERQRLLLQLKLKEKRLRREGKYDEAAALLGELRGNEENIRKLLEDARALHDQKLRERLERRRARLAQGLSEEECNELEAEENGVEEEDEKEKKKNILLYLDDCSEQERTELLKNLHNFGDERERERQRHLEMVRLRREERQLRNEDTVDAAMLLMGLAQNQHDKSLLSKEEEKRRQQELARQRLEMAKRMQKDNLVRGESVFGFEDLVDGNMCPADGKMEDVILGLLDVRHARERNMLLKLLEDHVNEAAQTEARNMPSGDIKAKLEEQLELFNLWRDSKSPAPADGQTILMDSVALSLEWKRRELEVEGQLLSFEDLKVELLAGLQEVQEAEASQAMLKLIDVDAEQVEKILEREQQKLTKPQHENLAAVLLETQDQGETEGLSHAEEEDGTDDEKMVMKALEKKYDGLKDKLLMEALIREMGEAEWSRLTDLERQKKLVELKVRERRLRREGKMDELAALLGNFAEDSQRITQILGETEEDQKQKLMKKLALRKRLKEEREAQGESLEEEELDKLVEEEDKKVQALNILKHLDKQFESEKEALLSALRDQPDHVTREKKRQHELARLKREERMLKKEEKFDSAAMIFARGEENIKSQAQSRMSEKERQQELARQRLEELRKKKADKLRGSTKGLQEMTDDADEPLLLNETTKMASNVLAQVEQIQTHERSKLSDLISNIDLSKTAKDLASLSNTDLQHKLNGVQSEHKVWESKTAKIVRTQAKLARLPNHDKSKFEKEMNKRREEQENILQRALSLKLEMEQRRLASLQPDATAEEMKEELSVCLMMALQEKQQKALASTQAGIEKQSEEELKEVLEQQKLACQSDLFVALPATCFNVLTASELADLTKKKSGVTFEEDSIKDVEMLLADEYYTEKDELLQRGAKEGINVDAALQKLGDQYEERKRALQTDLARQRADLRERVALKRTKADDLAWERATAAGQIFATGSENHGFATQAKKAELRRQDTLLQQKLQERRTAKQAKKSKLVEPERQAEKSGFALPSSRRVSTFSMTRERTVVDVTEDEKQAMYDQLLQQERFKHDQITAAQARQEQLLKKRLEDRSTRRENEVAALFSLGERQKTTLQEFKKGERERQLAQMQDRMARMRESRSQSPPKRRSEPAQKK